MLRLSQRMSNLSPSPTVSLNAKAQQLKAEGKQVINFGVGEPDFSTPQLVVDAAIAALKAGKTKYGPAGGSLPLRQAICDKLARDNAVHFRPADIVVGIGAKELLLHIAMGLFNEGEEILIPAPYWVSYISHVEATGATPIIIEMNEDPKAACLTPSMIANYVTPRTKAIYLNSPNNPAGYILNEQELRNLGQYLVTQNFWIIADEIYEYLDFDRPHKSLLSMFPELASRFILVNGMSKGFAMTGWRVGYCAGPSDIMDIVRGLQSHSSTCLPPFIEEAAIVALKQGRNLLLSQIPSLKSRRDLALKELGKIDGLNFMPPQGAFYILIDLRTRLAQSKNDMSSMSFSEKLLDDFLVAMVPGEAFGAPGYIRMSYAVSEQDITAGVSRLREALDSIKSK